MRGNTDIYIYIFLCSLIGGDCTAMFIDSCLVADDWTRKQGRILRVQPLLIFDWRLGNVWCFLIGRGSNEGYDTVTVFYWRRKHAARFLHRLLF